MQDGLDLDRGRGLIGHVTALDQRESTFFHLITLLAASDDFSFSGFHGDADRCLLPEV